MDSLFPTPISVLVVEADPEGDSLTGCLARVGDAEGVAVEVDRARTLEDALERLGRPGIDVVLLDVMLPDSEGVATFERAAARAPDVPFIIVGDEPDDRLALATAQGGAQDYWIRGEIRPAAVPRALLYAIERHRLISALRSLSLIDDLTGLYNRRGFTELGEQYLKLARRSGRAVTVVYLDVDRFKDINDAHGHPVGDQALRRVGEILRNTFRRSDIVARLGGDEFAVLALETSGEPAEWLAQRLREGVSMHNSAGDAPFQLAASVGVARAVGDDEVSLDDLLAQADAAMYREKREKQRAAYL
jgi:diguanylate cyclase (GGDEF)-like protein